MFAACKSAVACQVSTADEFVETGAPDTIVKQVPASETKASCSEVFSESLNKELLRAADVGNKESVGELLSRRADVNAVDEGNESSLHKAAYHGRKAVVHLLLAANADPGLVDKKGKTPMRKAYDNEEIVAALLEAHADPNAIDVRGGGTTLHRAAEGGYMEVVACLLTGRANLIIANEDGDTPLHTAATFNQAAVVQQLLDAKCDANARTMVGNAPLHLTAYEQAAGGTSEEGKEVIRMLLDAGADPNATNKDGESFNSISAAIGTNK